MKVKELIKELKAQDQELEVYIQIASAEKRAEAVMHKHINLDPGTYLRGQNWVIIK